jgi:hypothetical protein
MPPEDFDRILADIVDKMAAPELFSVPGVYEALSEFLKGDVIEQWVREQSQKDEPADAT